VTNSHPHRSGSVAVVHNGIIENYRDLRAELAALGIKPETDTDTEAVAQLTEHYMQGDDAPVEAAFRALDRLEGAFALAFIFDGYDDLIVVARQGSPLAIGHGDGEMYIGSDAIALAPMTNSVTYLEEGDRAILTSAGVTILNAVGAEVARPIKIIEIDSAHVDKDGYTHFMAKEIAEQSTVIGEAIRSYLPAGSDVTALEGIDLDFSNVDRLTLVACGTAYYACATAKYWFEQLPGLPVEIDVASEFRYREPPTPAKSLALFVSQSG
jgi:glutamine---fructose-6-phosphate transaminase (isomerizing)